VSQAWNLGRLPPGLTAADLTLRRPNFFENEFPTPAMLVRERAIENNVGTLAAYCRAHGVELAPHGKTTMAPQLFARQIAAGAWGISVATTRQAQVCRAFGIRRVMLANQLVDGESARWVADELAADSDFEFVCFVDSVEGVKLLEDALATAPPEIRLSVLVELGVSGGRAGCRSLEKFREVAACAGGSTRLRLAGGAAYEGSVAHGVDPESLGRVRSFLYELRDAVQSMIDEELIDADLDSVVVSAGGSAYFDLVAECLAGYWRSPRDVRTILRCGAYIGHDDGIYASVSPFSRDPGGGYSFEPALEVWGRILSRPEPTLAIVDVGRRDVPADQGLPLASTVRRRDGSVFAADQFEFTALHDQHGFVDIPADAALGPGDWIGFGISHPCTAFDKWRFLLVVDDSYRVIDSITTYF
jgi:D-serine deaminase-like pyridoxal phosphate-dependent protein